MPANLKRKPRSSFHWRVVHTTVSCRSHKKVSHNQVPAKCKTGSEEPAEWSEQNPSHQHIWPPSQQDEVSNIKKKKKNPTNGYGLNWRTRQKHFSRQHRSNRGLGLPHQKRLKMHLHKDPETSLQMMLSRLCLPEVRCRQAKPTSAQ